MSEPEIRYLGDVQRLVLNENDALVLKVKGAISEHVATRLREYVLEIFPGRKVLILSDEIDIGAVGPN